MGSPLSASTATWGSALPASAAGCAVRVTLRTKNGDLDLKMATIISAWVSTEPRARFCLVFYRWLTVADEKVTLSMVQVKRKPQHLVFAAHSLYHLSKLPKSAVERRKPPHFVRVLGLPVLHFRCSSYHFRGRPRLHFEASPGGSGFQGPRAVCFWVDLWRRPPNLCFPDLADRRRRSSRDSCD